MWNVTGMFYIICRNFSWKLFLMFFTDYIHSVYAFKGMSNLTSFDKQPFNCITKYYVNFNK